MGFFQNGLRSEGHLRLIAKKNARKRSRMSNMQKYMEIFFDEIEVFEDKERGHCYKIFIRQAIREFLANETKKTAFAVYRTFF